MQEGLFSARNFVLICVGLQVAQLPLLHSFVQVVRGYLGVLGPILQHCQLDFELEPLVKPCSRSFACSLRHVRDHMLFETLESGDTGVHPITRSA